MKSNLVDTRSVRIVHKLSFHYASILGRNTKYSFDDLYDDFFSIGYYTAFNAQKTYDPSQGTSLTTYATIRIRGSIVDHVRFVLPGSREVNKMKRIVHEEMSRLEQKHGSEINSKKFAQENRVGITREALFDMHKKAKTYEQCNSSDDVFRILADESMWSDPLEMIVNEELEVKVKELIAALPDEKMRYVIEQYFFEEQSHMSIGEQLGVSESRACQLVDKAFFKLKALYLREM